MGSPSIRDDIKRIQQLVLQQPLPSKQVLTDSLQLLASSDLRDEISLIEQPFLRIYGQFDSLVPYKVLPMINQLAPKSDHYVVNKASHAPFISHQAEFLSFVHQWLQNKVIKG